MQKEEEESADSLLCPSFSAYSSDALHRVADQVTRNDNRFGQNDDDAFEFGKVADAVFLDAACPAFPIFDRDLAGGGLRGAGEEAIQVTLGKLLMDDSPSSCSSSSEVDDELENVPPGTYCVWKPKAAAAASPCRKSKSTGSSSSRRWKLLDLLRRSNSEGKESVVFLAPSKKDGGNGKRAAASGGGGSERKVPAVSAHEALYVRNREMRREVKRRSYLPYRQDLVGFCVNLNAIGKSFPLHF